VFIASTPPFVVLTAHQRTDAEGFFEWCKVSLHTRCKSLFLHHSSNLGLFHKTNAISRKKRFEPFRITVISECTQKMSDLHRSRNYTQTQRLEQQYTNTIFLCVLVEHIERVSEPLNLLACRTSYSSTSPQSFSCSCLLFCAEMGRTFGQFPSTYKYF